MNLLEQANTAMQGNPNDWGIVTNFIGDKLASELQKHTIFTPKDLMQALVNSNGNLSAILATDEYLK